MPEAETAREHINNARAICTMELAVLGKYITDNAKESMTRQVAEILSQRFRAIEARLQRALEQLDRGNL